jgi:hypothetical protein
MQIQKTKRLYVCGLVLNRSEQLLFSVTPSHYIEFLSRLFGSIHFYMNQKISVVSKKVFAQNIDGYPVLADEDKVQRSRCKTVVNDLKGSETVFLKQS